MSFLGRRADDTALSPEMQSWLRDRLEQSVVPVATPPGYSGYNAPTAPAAADANRVLTPLGQGMAQGVTDFVSLPSRVLRGEAQVFDPLTGHGHIGAALERARAQGLDTAILRGLAEHGGDDQVVALTPGRVRSYYDPSQLLYSGGPGGLAVSLPFLGRDR